jgi:flagellar basal body-associated protein FliL
MPDRPLPEDTRQARTPFNDNYIIIGIVLVCVLMALVLLGAGMFGVNETSTTTQPSAPQSDPQTPAMGQPSPQAPPAPENNAR